MNDLVSFLNWLNNTMAATNVTQADIAASGYVTRGAVSQLISGKTKSVGVEMCKAVSAATNTPLETVMQMAGILPVQPELTIEQREIVKLMRTTDPQTAQFVLDILRANDKRKQGK